MKNRKSILLLLCIIFISCGHPAEFAASGIQQSLEKLKEKLETLSAKLKSLSGSLGTLRYNLDTEEQAAQVIAELANKELSDVIDEAKSESEKVAVAKRLFYADKEGKTAIKKVVEEKGGEGLDNVYKLLNQIPKNQRVALMDNVVKGIDIGTLEDQKKKEFFGKVIVMNGLDKSLDKVIGMFGTSTIKEWLEQKMDDSKVSLSGSSIPALHLLDVDRTDFITTLFDKVYTSNEEQKRIMTEKVGDYTLLDRIIYRGNVNIIKQLKEKEDFNELIDKKIISILKEKAEQGEKIVLGIGFLTSFLEESENPGPPHEKF